jgi:hypothetical protein
MNARLMKLAEQFGLNFTDGGLQKFAELVAADEREACIEICVQYRDEKSEKHIGKMVLTMIANYPELFGEIKGAHNCAVLIKQRGGDVCSD